MSGQEAGSELAGRMVFLVGARRSGTNWLQRIITTHPGVASLPSETHLFSHGMAPLVARIHHGPSGSPRTASLHMERDDLLAACRAFCDRVFAPYLRRATGARVLVERTPWHVYHLDLITAVYPDARVVHIIRDGRDVARSLLTQPWGPTKPADIRAAADEWRRAVVGAREVMAASAHYREVRYEELLAEPRQVIAELFTWLGLPAGDRAVDAALAEAGSTFNVDPSAPTIATDKWRSGLSRAEVAAVLETAGETLDELGYLRAGAPRAGRSPRPAARAAVGSLALGARRSVHRTRDLVSSYRSRRASQAGDESVPSAPPNEMEAAALAVDRLVDLVHTGRWEQANDVVDPGVSVRVVAAGSDENARGEDGIRLLASATSDLVGRRQRLGDVHPGGGTFTVVLVHDSEEDAASVESVLVVHPDPSRVVGVTYYRFPTGQV